MRLLYNMFVYGKLLGIKVRCMFVFDCSSKRLEKSAQDALME